MPFVAKQPHVQTFRMQVDRWIAPKKGTNHMAFGFFEEGVEDAPDLCGQVFETHAFSPETAPAGTIVNVSLNRINDRGDAVISEFVSFDEDPLDMDPDEGGGIGPVSTAPASPDPKIVHARVSGHVQKMICEESWRRNVDRRIVAGEYLEKAVLNAG